LEHSQAFIRLELPGEVEGARDAVLAAALGGYVERVQVESGERVAQGQLLVQVDAATHRARLAQTRVELSAAEREHQRAERLGNAIPSAQRDAAESRYAAAVAAQRSAQIAVSRAAIRAPFAGIVANLDVEVGEVAPPGAPVLRLVHVDTVKVSISVSDRDVVALREGMPATVRTDAQGSLFHGTIAHIDPAADTRTRAFKVQVEVENPEHRLLPGMIATVRVEQEAAADQLIVPQDWIVTKRDGLGVFVLSADDRVSFSPVELGPVVGSQVIVANGLEHGARVVVNGHRELVDGEPVVVVRSGVCCTEGRVVFEQ
jgi:membrane fusion protein (multidrug efflux system)